MCPSIARQAGRRAEQPGGRRLAPGVGLQVRQLAGNTSSRVSHHSRPSRLMSSSAMIARRRRASGRPRQRPGYILALGQIVQEVERHVSSRTSPSARVSAGSSVGFVRFAGLEAGREDRHGLAGRRDATRAWWTPSSMPGSAAVVVFKSRARRCSSATVCGTGRGRCGGRSGCGFMVALRRFVQSCRS